MAQDLESTFHSHIDQFYKILDVPRDGNQVRQVTVRAVSLDPPNADQAIRVIVNDLPRPIPPKETVRIGCFNHLTWQPPAGHYGNELNLYSRCTGPFYTAYQPHYEYHGATNVPGINYSRLYSLPVLRKLFEENIQPEWFVMEVFVWHSCLTSSGRSEKVPVAFTMLQKEGDYSEGQHTAGCRCVHADFYK